MDWKIPEQKQNEYKDAHKHEHMMNILIEGKCRCGQKGMFTGEPAKVTTQVRYPKDY